MEKGQRFRLTRSSLAIAHRDSRNVPFTVSEGSIIEIIGGPFNGEHLMDVSYAGEIIMMLRDDLENHIEPVEGG